MDKHCHMECYVVISAYGSFKKSVRNMLQQGEKDYFVELFSTVYLNSLKFKGFI